LAHLSGIPEKYKKEIIEALKRPEGTFEFIGRFYGLFDPTKGRGILLQVPSGETLLRLERDEELNLHFYYASPGTGTRVASVNILPLKGASAIHVFLCWSPKEIRLHVADADDPKKQVVGYGKPTVFQFRVGKDGGVYRVGDEGVEVMGERIFVGGEPVLQPTALGAWKETLKAIEILLTGKSPEGYIFDVVVANMIIVMLATGLEAYCKTRFLELEGEGITPNYDELGKLFSSKVFEEIKREASQKNASIAQLIVDQRRIDFGNYERCKEAFNKGYCIKFGELGIPNQILEEIQRLINYRHRIVHVSPLMGMLNQDKVPPEKPIFSTNYVKNAIEVSKLFIESLHQATLKLKKNT
jgi:hypothetical protein